MGLIFSKLLENQFKWFYYGWLLYKIEKQPELPKQL